MKRLPLLLLLSILLASVAADNSFADMTDIIAASEKSGVYREDITLSLFPYRDSTILYYRIRESENTNKVVYTTPLELTALPGEERTYTIEVEAINEGAVVHTSNLQYTVDKLVPQPPKLTGLHIDTLELTDSTGRNKNIHLYEIPEELVFISNKNEKIYYTWDMKVNQDFILWGGETLSLEEYSGKEKISLSAFSQDKAGNKSNLVSWIFHMPREKTLKPGNIDIKSPINGSFYNSQMLYITHNGCDKVQYAIKDENGKTINSGTYIKPIMLNYTGVLTLYAWGREKETGELIEKTVQFTVISGGGAPPLSLSSGIYFSSFTLQPAEGSGNDKGELYKISFDKGEHYTDFSAALTINPISGAISFTSIIIKGSGEEKKSVWRYSFLIDAKPVPSPVIQGKGKTLLNGKTTISIQGTDDCDIYYTLDGTTPDINAERYKGPFEINLPKNVANGSLSVKAKAYRFTGKESDQSTEIFFFDLKAPAPPIVNLVKTEEKGTLGISVSAEADSILVYTLSYSSEPPEAPDISSPTMPKFTSLSIPRGMHKNFSLKIAAIDKAGNISAPSSPKILTIDNHPYSPPTITVKENSEREENSQKTTPSDLAKIVTLTGDGNMYFFVKESPYSTTNFLEEQFYGGAFTLEGKRGRLTDYYIFTYSLDEIGNNSGFGGPWKVLIDDRNPRKDLSFSIEDGGVYKGNEKYTTFLSPYSDLVFHYTYDIEGKTPANPSISSPLTEKEIFLEGKKGEETNVKVKVLPHFLMSGHLGEIIEFECILDDRPPPSPVLMGKTGSISENETYNAGQYVSAICSENNAEVYVSVSTDEKTDPLEMGRKVEREFLIDTELGSEKRFVINAVSQDTAGNLTYIEEPIVITIDRKPPKAPIPVGIPPRGITNTDVEITLVAEDEGDIYYAFTKDGRMPRLNFTEDERYIEPFTIYGEDDQETKITIVSAVIDPVGNISQKKRISRFTIDKEPPLSEESISVTKLNQNKWSLSWKSSADGEQIMYKLPGENTFSLYTSPVTITLKKSDFIQYYLVDTAGNQGPLVRHPLTVVPSPSFSVSGVEEGGIYNSERKVYFNSSGVVRYEISYNEDPPKEVSHLSPKAPEILLLDVPKGETRKIHLSAKAFPSEQSMEESSRVQHISFTMDKTPPLLPEIIGVEQGMTYMEAKVISLSVPEGKAFLRVTKEFSNKKIDGEVEFIENPKEYILACPTGEVVTYTLSTYSVDDAGNNSTGETKFTCVIDKKHLHVFPERKLEEKRDVDTPILSLEEGVELAKESGRTTVLLAPGVYSVKNTIFIDAPIEIRGTNEGNTFSIQDIPSITLSPESNGPIFRIGPQGDLTLSGLHLYGPILQGNEIPLFELSKGTVSFHKGILTLEKGNPGIILRQNLGTFSLTDITVESSNTPASSLFRCNGGTTSIKDSSIVVEGTREIFSLFNLGGGSDLGFINSQVTLDGGDNSRIVKGLNCTLSLDTSDFLVRNSKNRSLILEIQNGRVAIRKSTLSIDGKSEISIPLHITGTSLTMEDTECESHGEGGVIPMMVKNSFINIKDSSFIGRGGRDFIYLFRADGVRGSLLECTFTSQPSVESKGFVLADSTIEFSSSILSTGGGTTVHHGFEMDSRSRLLINSSTIQSNEKYPGGTALVLGKTPTNENEYITVKDSVFSKWNILVEGPVEAFSTAEFNLLDGKRYGGFIDGNTEK